MTKYAADSRTIQNMKHFFTLLLLLCATLGKAQDFVEVSNLSELKAAIDAAKYGEGGKYSNAKIRLTDDIYLDGMSNTLCNTFTGEIDGGYLVKDENGQEWMLKHFICSSKPGEETTRKKCSYLFTYMENATIKNVAFYNIRVESADRDNMGVIATTATSSTFQEVSLDSCSVFTNCSNAGALVGQAKSCTFDIVFVRKCDITTDGIHAGGFVGYSEGNTYQGGGAGLATAVFADGNNWIGTNGGWSGGIAGYSKNDNFSYMANMALVGADQSYVGGFAGESVGSTFFQCQNSGFVGHIDEDDFRKYHDKIKEYLKTHMDVLGAAWTMGTVTGGISAIVAIELCALTWKVETALAIANMQAGFFSVVVTHGSVAASYTSYSVFALSFGSIGVCAIIVGAAIGISWYIFVGDDAVGGFCGKATGGSVEQCINTSSLKCKDDYCGGIVGLGRGVIINNCLNEGELDYDEDDTTGSILGKAEADDNGKKCVVTNCFSTVAYQIIGGESISAGVDLASGNNYRIIGDNAVSTCVWEMPVDAPMLKRGLVTHWLNTGIENRAQGIRPWHQNLWARQNHGELISRDAYPLLDATHDEVNADLFYQNDVDDDHVYIIKSPAQLQAFASAVNNGEQYAMGFLDNDIDMTGVTTWTPIGSDAHRFRGLFNGRGYTIKGLNYLNKSDIEGAGLFGTIDVHAQICNITIDETSQIVNNGDGGAGAIVGTMHANERQWGHAIIENCVNYGKVSANKHGGGIFGRVRTDTESDKDGSQLFINHCYNMGEISASGMSGLIAGYVKNHGTINSCLSGGALLPRDNSNSAYDNRTDQESFAGYESKITLTNCYYLGNLFDGIGQEKVGRISVGALRDNIVGSILETIKDPNPLFDMNFDGKIDIVDLIKINR